MISEYEVGKYVDQHSNLVRHHDATIFQLECVAFMDSLGGCHFILQKDKRLQSGCKAYFTCKGHFVGIHNACQECNQACEFVSNTQYEGESCQWNWDKHCTKFQQQIGIIKEWVVATMAMHMSNEDQISAFLKTIPKDCKNAELMSLLLGNAVWKMAGWWGPLKVSIIHQRYGPPCPQHREGRSRNSARGRHHPGME